MKIIIFGAGIAGLTAAGELTERGHEVVVYEANPDAGGFFRSARLQENSNTPSEYSWHGFGPWYHNTFDLMKSLPFDESSSLYSRVLSRPLSYGLAPDSVKKPVNNITVFRVFKKFDFNIIDGLRLGWIMLKQWSADQRTQKEYALKNAADVFDASLSDSAAKTWKSVLGPWIGSDWTRVSYHHAGLFFKKNLFSGKSHYHSADSRGDSWAQDPGGGWLVLRGPSSDYWFDRWVKHLSSKGVKFKWNSKLTKLNYSNGEITSAVIDGKKSIVADMYVLAINPFATNSILNKTPSLQATKELNKFKSLVQDGPHTQVAFQITFKDSVNWTKPRSAFLLPDSPYNITLYAVEQSWDESLSLGKDVKSLWTGTTCVGSVKGKLHRVDVEHATKKQFKEEVLYQIRRNKTLNELLKQANNGKGFDDFDMIDIQVWHEWHFSKSGIKADQPKWVTSYSTQPNIPAQKTAVSNLILAGAHTKTSADIWSIEGAVESGRRAARLIEPKIKVIKAHNPLIFRLLGVIDNVLFSVRAPHVLTVLLSLAVLFVSLSVLRMFVQG